jgi:AraC family transcriptional regulator
MIANVLRSGIQPAKPRGAPWLRMAEELIRARFTEAVGLNSMAKEIGVCPVHLAREFRRHYGCTVGQRIRQLRVEHALNLILHSGRPLSEIALSAGFADQSHFSRTFRKQTGMTPSQFSGAFRRVTSVPTR